jgi:pyruvate dehydrogenase E1 component beta subunit
MPIVEMTYRDALRQCLISEMERDEDVFVLGEDVGRYQGTFRVTAGLFQKYGQQRILDTPITEPGIVGMATGAAMVGLRPVVEMMTMSFSILALDQIINHTAKIHYMTNGQAKVPLVIRGPGGAANQLSAQHSQSLEGWYAHVPGLKVVAPATPACAVGMLRSAIRDDNPVIFNENPGLYGLRGLVDDDPDFMVPFGKARIARHGKDISLIAYSRMVHVCLAAAEKLSEQGIDAEVVDVRSLLPLDAESIYSSVRKTHRAVVVYEDWKSGGFGAEIASRIGEDCFNSLDAPVGRVGGLNVPMPYSRPLELQCIPNEADVIAEVNRIG